MTTHDEIVGPGRPSRGTVVAGVGVTLVISVVVLLWSKWVPYAGRLAGVATTGRYPGSSILTVGGVKAGDAPSWGAAVSFTLAYATAVWKALVAALLISAALRVLVPRRWLLRVLDQPGRLRASLAGGLVATPTMMCTCCTAPVAATLRRSGVRTAAVVAYWLGNPLLNPAVLAFLAVVAPWQWTVTRLVFGLLLVVGGAALVGLVTDDRAGEAATEALTGSGDRAGDGPTDGAGDGPTDERPTGTRLDAAWLRRTAAVYLRTLLRLTVVLVPEYLVVVMVVGVVAGGALALLT